MFLSLSEVYRWGRQGVPAVEGTPVFSLMGESLLLPPLMLYHSQRNLLWHWPPNSSFSS